GRIEQFEQGLVARAESRARVGKLEQALDFVHPQVTRQALAQLRRIEVQGRVRTHRAFPQRELEEVPQGDQMTRHRTAVELLPVEAGEKVNDLLAADGLEIRAASAQEGGELFQVAFVSSDRIGSQSFLHS